MELDEFTPLVILTRFWWHILF